MLEYRDWSAIYATGAYRERVETAHPPLSRLYLYEPVNYAPLARVDTAEGDTENRVYYFHTDQIGTPLEMTDAEGQIVWQAKYRAWGAIDAMVVNEVEQNLRFQGQYFDDETGCATIRSGTTTRRWGGLPRRTRLGCWVGRTCTSMRRARWGGWIRGGCLVESFVQSLG